MRYTLFFFIVWIITSCSEGDSRFDQSIIDENTTVISGDYVISDTLTIEEGKILRIMPGANVTFQPGALILAFGNIHIEGTEKEPINLTAVDPIGDHRILWIKGTCKILNIFNTNIKNGLITSYNTANHFKNIHFSNEHNLQWNDAVARFWLGSLLIEDCVLDWNNHGEGFLVHKTHNAVIRNCVFNKVPDGVEFLHCRNGLIQGNVFRGMGDDGVDQNHCKFTRIEDNEFYDVRDRALELGSESFGNSDSLMVKNNLFVNCKVAINVKESSTATIENATFYNNGIHLDVHTPDDSTTLSKVTMTNSVLFGGDMQISSNPRSETRVMNCVSNMDFPEKYGTTNFTTSIVFEDIDNENFNFSLDSIPANISFLELGYQRK